jgi:hypothetical protein
MRKLYLSVLATGLAVFATLPALAAPRMEMSESEFDFGYVPQNSEISHIFWLYNRGDDSLKIEKVVPG